MSETDHLLDMIQHGLESCHEEPGYEFNEKTYDEDKVDAAISAIHRLRQLLVVSK